MPMPPLRDEQPKERSTSQKTHHFESICGGLGGAPHFAPFTFCVLSLRFSRSYGTYLPASRLWVRTRDADGSRMEPSGMRTTRPDRYLVPFCCPPLFPMEQSERTARP